MAFFDRLLKRLSHNKVTVLAFHKVPRQVDMVAPDEPDITEFSRIIGMVSDIFPIIPLHDAVTRIGNRALPKGAVCLTFDDGYVDWLETVVPFLKQYDIPATFFLTTGQIDDTPLWHERLRHIVAQANHSCSDITDPLLRRRTNLGSIRDRIRTARIFEQSMKILSVEQRDHLIRQLEDDAGMTYTHLPRLSETQIRSLHAYGFEIGAHSVNHPILTQCGETEARNEIVDAKTRLESIIGGTVHHFAYPNGRKTDFDHGHVELVRRAGYEHAFTTEPGTWNDKSEKFQIPRFTPWGPSAGHITWQLARNLIL